MDTVKFIKNIYFIIKINIAAVFQFVAFPLQCLLVVVSIVVAVAAHKRYVVDIEKRFPFTNPYQYAKAALAERDENMEDMQDSVRGSIAALAVGIAS